MVVQHVTRMYPVNTGLEGPCCPNGLGASFRRGRHAAAPCEEVVRVPCSGAGPSPFKLPFPASHPAWPSPCPLLLRGPAGTGRRPGPRNVPHVWAPASLAHEASEFVPSDGRGSRPHGKVCSVGDGRAAGAEDEALPWSLLVRLRPEAEGEGRSPRPPLGQPPARWASSSLSGVSLAASGCWLDAGRPEPLTLLPRADCASLPARLLARRRPGASAPWKWTVSHRPPAPRARGQQPLWSLWFWGPFFRILFLDNLKKRVDPQNKAHVRGKGSDCSCGWWPCGSPASSSCRALRLGWAGRVVSEQVQPLTVMVAIAGVSGHPLGAAARAGDLLLPSGAAT